MSGLNEVPTIADERTPKQLLRDLVDDSSDDLEPITPERALNLYLEDKQRECRQATVNSHQSRLGLFVDWCDEQEINNMNDLTARDLHEFRVWRRQDLNTVSEKTQMDTLRVFIQWCETIDAVQFGLFKKIKSPTLSDNEDARETVIQVERANEIRAHLSKYEYASIEYVVWLILSETGMRMGAAHALDVEDYQSNAEQPHLNIVHRPETETPNQER